MKQKLLMSIAICGSLFWSNNVLSQTCTTTPSCAELGYTKTKSECSENGIKCPFGNFWNCKTVLKCQIGWIYYADGTCSAPAAHVETKTVLGIVTYIKDGGKHGEIMSPWPVDASGSKIDVIADNKRLVWSLSTETGQGVTTLPKYISAYMASGDFNSCSNTDKIMAAGDKNHYPAAWAARLYEPTRETKGKWCLPAAGTLGYLEDNKNVIEAAFTKLKIMNGFTNQMKWSSTQSSAAEAWGILPGDGMGLVAHIKTGRTFVYPVLEF